MGTGDFGGLRGEVGVDVMPACRELQVWCSKDHVYTLIDLEAAKKLVLTKLNTWNYCDPLIEPFEEHEMIIIESETIEKPYGWVLFATKRKYVETGDSRYALFGNGPIVVEARDGRMTHLGTAHGPEVYIREYERWRPFTRLIRILISLSDEYDKFLTWMIRQVHWLGRRLNASRKFR